MPSASQPTHPADRLLNAIDARRAPVCVGLDPVLNRLPNAVAPDAEPIERLRTFCFGVLRAVADHVPCVKPQAACFERYRKNGRGVAVLNEVIAEAKRLGMEVILDAKRGDIGVTAEHYAAMAFGEGADSDTADWITINSYLGADGITPFLKPGRGAFALVRTSNPGGDALQSQTLASGGTVADTVAAMVREIGEPSIGERGYSALGAVVGATKPEDAARLRDAMPRQLFLVPGYGAQGGGAKDILPCFHDDGTGAVINASRSVIYAFEPNDEDWMKGVERAARTMIDDIRAALATD
ncbi:MAG: orotidine-5'-phosphate decarboxylase [Phycisphaerales bacterium]|nr:MAG: orotidine-5'-phosphate decarboxylase [Phycisphaerales bacterium]